MASKKNKNQHAKKKDSTEDGSKTKNKNPKKRKASNVVQTTSKVNVATFSQKVEFLNWHHKNGKNQSRTADHFEKVYPELKIKQPLISKWLKSEDNIQMKHDQSAHFLKKKVWQISHPQVKAALAEWMTQAIHCNLTITGNTIKAKCLNFAFPAQIPSEEWLKLSGGWLESFKKRHQLRSYCKHGESASANITIVKSKVERLIGITKNYPLKDIFNMHETGLFSCMFCDEVILPSSKKLTNNFF